MSASDRPDRDRPDRDRPDGAGQSSATDNRWHLSAPEDPAVLAAVTAAVQAMWPRGAVAEVTNEPSRWRFSARWWNHSRGPKRRRPSTR